MKAKIYTLPTCHKCKDVKDYLAERKLEYTEVCLDNEEGVKDLRSYYKHVKDTVPRLANGALMLPIVIFFENDEVNKVCHELEQVKLLVG